MRGSIVWLLDFDKRPRRTFTRSPRTVPGENTLPWAVVMISQTAVADDRGRASACAKVVDASTSRGVGISVTAKIPNACGWCGVGRRRSGRPNGAKTRPPKPSMPWHFPRSPRTRAGVSGRTHAAARSATRHNQRDVAAATARVTRLTDRVGPQSIASPAKPPTLGQSGSMWFDSVLAPRESQA